MGPKDLPTSVTFGSPREALDRGMKNIGSSSLAPTGLGKHAPRRYKLGSTGSSATGLSRPTSTGSPCATWPRSGSPPCPNGCADLLPEHARGARPASGHEDCTCCRSDSPPPWPDPSSARITRAIASSRSAAAAPPQVNEARSPPSRPARSATIRKPGPPQRPDPAGRGVGRRGCRGLHTLPASSIVLPCGNKKPNLRI